MVYKIIDLVGVSSKDHSAAVSEAVKEASKTIRGIERVIVKSLEASVENNRIKEYRAYVQVVFKIER
ncbi:MAG: dodecin family protein [Halobacteria archaeon]